MSARQSTLVETQHVVARGGELVEVHFQRVADAPSAGRPSTVWIRATSPSESPEAPADLVPREKWITVLALGSAAVLAAGLGVGLGAEAKGQASDVQTERATLDPANKGDACIGAAGSSAACRRLNDDVQSAHRNWNLSIASYIGAGALGLAALATWTLWHPQGQKPSALSVQPALASNGGGLLVGSAW